jgi:hypothetical protein
MIGIQTEDVEIRSFNFLIMNTHKAIQIVKRNKWKVVVLENGNYSLKHNTWAHFEEYTPRQLVDLARCYTHENKRTTNINKFTKKEHNGKNRAATRDALNIADYDAIPLNAPTDCGDRWNWD